MLYTDPSGDMIFQDYKMTDLWGGPATFHVDTTGGLLDHIT